MGCLTSSLLGGMWVAHFFVARSTNVRNSAHFECAIKLAIRTSVVRRPKFVAGLQVLFRTELLPDSRLNILAAP
jgi:hypothetical protein